MTRFLTAVLLCVLPFPALALSCAPFDPLRAFEMAQSSAQEYVIVHGALEFNGRKAPVSHDSPARKTVLAARFVGQALSPRGFTVQVSAPVTLTIQCAGSWCPNLRPGPDKLLFLSRINGTYHLHASACRSFAFPKPTEETLDAMVQCLNGSCPAPRRPRRR